MRTHRLVWRDVRAPWTHEYEHEDFRMALVLDERERERPRYLADLDSM